MDDIARIADALERIARHLGAVPDDRTDAGHGHWFTWSDAGLMPAVPARTAPLTLYVGVDAQKAALAANMARHAAALPSHDVLLWGSRGMGKSSLVRAVHADLVESGHDTALVQLAQDDLAGLPLLFKVLGAVNRRFTVFLDDVSLGADDGQVHALRSLLDGGVSARPDNLRLIVTSNRRNLVPRSMADNDADAINPRDAQDDKLALADRFGLRLGFHGCDQTDYLAMCKGYAHAHGLDFDAAAALAFAAGRGARSGRIAWQFTVEQAGAAGRMLA
ncbi:DUF815 domain-containing protein [Sandarakinorhabdus sp.]|uniref:DUF815 domain-containing protein n=1 Tax=Sandarakinorhabdus sp. TaxID=1916663 RepID=UPI00286DCD05|nr:DUF815 domain-containing protein [Sandarakinorhabdus sp.]